MTETIRVFLLDDHEIVRRGIADLLNAETDIEVVGEASTAAQALGRVTATMPTVALLDVRLPDGSGIDVCRDIRSTHPEIRCLILTGYDDDEAIGAAVLAGAAGYVLKDVRGSRILEAIRMVAAGTSLIDPALSRRVVEKIAADTADDPRLGSLGLRESQILSLIADGLTNRQIGVELGLAEKTIKNYVSGLLAKLGLQRRTQAAILRLGQRPTGDA
ncbi:response regulator [Lacisediminihabitans changchengi]|uniref:Response regulator transcription factor n=1 Tax=Lacisediminihabitans changchengi TaxID=2787634 RepID=A0A934STN7_9MICO|nr:response regulator transcription factor [Lacisediminihabitans changchengi]MBK4346968.1 response regulator transcription factor [Lacisediminihabitans changchengi]MBK4347909.1 response regulator transcription factor [Lacisediminihabitans changchengi]